MIEGAKTATADDFVTFDEFRVFNAYACVYAAMFDAFAKIDGGGAGRDANDDLRVDLDEWKRGYKNVASYGFVAFEGLKEKSKKDAKAIFEEIDDNGVSGSAHALEMVICFATNSTINDCDDAGRHNPFGRVVLIYKGEGSGSGHTFGQAALRGAAASRPAWPSKTKGTEAEEGGSQGSSSSSESERPAPPVSVCRSV